MKNIAKLKFVVKKNCIFMLFTVCICLGLCLVACSNDDEPSLSHTEEKLVGVYISGVNDVRVRCVELKSDKTGASWTELNNGTNLPITEKVPFTWSATSNQITFKGGKSPYNTTWDYTFSNDILYLENSLGSVTLTKYY